MTHPLTRVADNVSYRRIGLMIISIICDGTPVPQEAIYDTLPSRLTDSPGAVRRRGERLCRDGDRRHASRIVDSMFSGNIRGVTLALSEQIGLCATRRRNRAVMPIPWVLVRFDLRCGVVACKLFTCCRSARRVPSSGWFPVLLVWWWFENSRACLYYFFIVNDCQFIPRLIACRGGRVPGRV